MTNEDAYEGSRSGPFMQESRGGFLLFSEMSGSGFMKNLEKYEEGYLTKIFLCDINLSAVSHD